MGNEKLKIYISGGITGVEDFAEHFAKAERELAQDGFAVVNPAKIATAGVLPDCCAHDDYMRVDLALLGICDGIYMLRGWQDSCGANREYGYALAAGKTIMFE